jgi:hypothetical protein
MASIRKAFKSHQTFGKKLISNSKDKVVVPVKSGRFNKTFTITFGDMAENHVGMQKIGTMATNGFSLVDMEKAKRWFEGKGVVCELVNLEEMVEASHRSGNTSNSYMLIARKGLNAILQENNLNGDAKTSSDDVGNNGKTMSDLFYEEQDKLAKDTHAFMYGRVVEKHARHNLCFGPESQEPSYTEGKGRVICYDDVPLLNKVRLQLPNIMGSIADNLVAEGNYYYDLSKCGIGYHGDSERRKVVGVRIGASFPLCFYWFQNSNPISERATFTINHGDVYMFSEKATGCDWKKKIIPTLRHAAGCDKFINFKAKSKK